MLTLLRYLLLAILIVLLGSLYFNRKKTEKFFADSYHQKKEYSSEKFMNPNAIYSIFKSYKIAFYLFFSFFNTFLSMAIIHLIFKNKEYTYLTFGVYSCIFFLVSGLILLGVIWFKNLIFFSFIYYLKLSLYTPYILLFLIIYFWKLKPVNN